KLMSYDSVIIHKGGGMRKMNRISLFAFFAVLILASNGHNAMSQVTADNAADVKGPIKVFECELHFKACENSCHSRTDIKVNKWYRVKLNDDSPDIVTYEFKIQEDKENSGFSYTLMLKEIEKEKQPVFMPDVVVHLTNPNDNSEVNALAIDIKRGEGNKEYSFSCKPKILS
ncbi:MAG: hypothetical protein NTW04_02150, partial [Elusimicrobia bacterium]|nr:hypothetical protein [Elusimicrobiota bacterium]